LTIYFTPTVGGEFSLHLVNEISGQTTVLRNPSGIEAGENVFQYNTGNIPTGYYAVVAGFRGNIFSKTILKL
jgi:hypothetical protein